MYVVFEAKYVYGEEMFAIHFWNCAGNTSSHTLNQGHTGNHFVRFA